MSARSVDALQEPAEAVDEAIDVAANALEVQTVRCCFAP